MRNVLTILVLILFVSTQVFSQNNVFEDIFSTKGLRISGGITYSTWSNVNVDEDDVSTKWIPGTSIGVEKLLPNDMFLGLTFTQRGAEFKWKDDDDNEKWNYKLNYFTLYTAYPINISKINAFIGVELGSLLKVKVKAVAYGDTETETLDRDEYESVQGILFDYGILAGIVYDITPQIALKTSFYLGLPLTHDNLEGKNRSIRIAVVGKL